MGWKIIDIDQPSYLKTYLNNLIVLTTKRISIPMNDIDVLMISNNQTSFTVNAINDLVNNGVCVILCNNQKLPNSYILGYKVQKQSYINFKNQLKWTDKYKKKCWFWLVKNKILNQLNFLSFKDIYVQNFLSELDDNCNKLNDSLFEAKIASYFFKNLYGTSFNRKKNNLINSCLNYGYIVLSNMTARSIAKKGLNSHISFFHGSIYSSQPLAYDIVEIFRIIIDVFVQNLFENNIIHNKDVPLTKEIKNCLLDFIANYKINIDGKFEFINNSIDKVIDWIIAGDFEKHKIEYDFALEKINEKQLII